MGKSTRNSKPGVIKKRDGEAQPFGRSKATSRRLRMYRDAGKPVRNRKGKVVEGAEYQKWTAPGTVARVEPNRRWFGNTRVVTQQALQTFQDEMGKVKADPYRVVMKRSKLPVSLLQEKAKHVRSHLLETEKFDHTFGKNSRRKRPTLKVGDMEELAANVADREEKYASDDDRDLDKGVASERPEAQELIFTKGQSKRIWGELYKVVDASDVVIQVLDARDPMGTRSKRIEKYLKTEKAHKHLIFVLNKCDLCPAWATRRWVATLSAEHPTLAFHASLTNAFGKGAVISLLRQFSKLHPEKKQISVGFIGYPNVGKSSVINALRAKKVCNVAPLAGETKVWQYITLMRRIFLIDCPGVVYPSGDSETDMVLKGVVRIENIPNPDDHIPAVLKRIKAEHVQKMYGLQKWGDATDFLERLAQKTGRLLKGGEPDVCQVARMVLNDWQRGKLPYFSVPPKAEGDEGDKDDSSAKDEEQQQDDVKEEDEDEGMEDEEEDEDDMEEEADGGDDDNDED
ncbi:nucleolar GTP-binding protein 2-like [Sycon ciliatum]|uniref:nucleolar GTP-binding protein 2-like n=1 Tax=Sycon ciliatum TaxID=27933 RepID=UPI0031F64F1A